jgi:hypothetical protein
MQRQQQIFNLYRGYRTSPPNVFNLFARNLWRYLLAIVLFCLVVILSYAARLPGLATFALGLMIGALLRDLAAFIRFTKTWPITELVLDWEKIHTLLETEQ